MDLRSLVVKNELMAPGDDADSWDSIVMAPEGKDRLLRSVVLGLHLRGTVPFHVSALHGLALLVGPPGTGKSTLVRGLAGQVAGVVSGKRCRLIEINPHGLMSAEHGQSQQRVNELFTELIPSLADDQVPTILMLDEVESIAVARSAASLSANPADVHRATDAILTALDDTATRWPHIFTVATSNFASALDEAFKSRADVTISMPLPDEMGVAAILRATLMGFGTAYPALSGLAADPKMAEVAPLLVGEDGRSIRKSVTDAMLLRLAVTVDPNLLTVQDLLEAVTLRRVTEMEPTDAKN
jgi:AAA+ superfamily predicted ATPase